jgi:hypothetical protein
LSERRYVDTMGRIEKFERRRAAARQTQQATPTETRPRRRRS